MTGTGHRRLVFRLEEIGFLLDLKDVVEIVEQISGLLDQQGSDLSRWIVAAFTFRETWIPAVDPAISLGMPCRTALQDKVAVVLKGSEGNWALLVDRVEELIADEGLLPCELPFLLKNISGKLYSRIKLHNGEPLVVFEPECYYGTAFAS